MEPISSVMEASRLATESPVGEPDYGVTTQDFGFAMDSFNMTSTQQN